MKQGRSELATKINAKNQQTQLTYHLYGELTHIARGTVSSGVFTEDATQRFDIANPLRVATPQGSSSSQSYGYDASNQRVYAATYVSFPSVQYSNKSIYFYGADGKKLGVCSLTCPVRRHSSRTRL